MERPEFPKFIDSTMRKDVVSCGGKFFLNHVWGYKPRGFSIHLHFGGCIAKGLEDFRMAYYRDGKSFDESFATGAEAIIKMWAWEEAPEYGSGNKKTLEACLLAFGDFFIQYPPDTDPIQPYMIDGKPAVEFSFALPIPNVYHPTTLEPMLYSGRFDMLGVFQKSVYVNDEKTSSYLGDQWLNSWELNSQLTGYCWAAKQFGYPVQGAIIRGIGILKSETKFLLAFQRRSEWAINRWMEQLQRDVLRAIAQWKEGIWDYTLDDACNSYNGCQFKPVCLAKRPQKVLDAEYEIRHWDPLAKDK